MARFRIDVVVDPRAAQRGLRAVDQQLISTERRANRTRNSVRGLFAGLGIALAVRQVRTYADTFVRVENRLRNVTDGQRELIIVQRELFGIAEDTRASYEGTAELFVRLAQASKLLGRSQQELLNFTKSLNQALILSGATGQEARQGLIQLSQAIASNTLRGDELRSVLEQLPVVADVIAESLGITRGELRTLGQQGRLTGTAILDAFKEARVELETRFAETVPTIGQSFEILNNAVIRYIGETDRASGVTRLLSRAIIDLSQNLDNVARILGAALLGAVLGRVVSLLVTLNRTVATSTASWSAFNAVLRANALVAISTALIAIISLLVTFSDKILFGGDSITTLADVGIEAFETLQAAGSELVDLFIEFADQIGLLPDDFTFSFESILTGAAQLADGITGFLIGSFNVVVLAIEKVFSEDAPAFFEFASATLVDVFGDAVEEVLAFLQTLGDSLKTVFTETVAAGALAARLAALRVNPLTAFSDSAEETQQRLEDALARAGSAFDNFGVKVQVNQNRLDNLFDNAPELSPEATALGEELAEAFRAGFDPTVLGAEDLVAGIIERARERARRRQQEEEAAEQAAGNLGFLDDIPEGRTPLTASQAELLQSIDNIGELQAQVADLNILYARGAINIDEYNLALDRLIQKGLSTSTSVAAGFERAFAAIREESVDFARVIEESFDTVLGGLEDGLVELAETGQVNFRQLADSVVRDLLRIIARLLIVQALSAATGLGPAAGAFVNVGSGAVSGSFADGGTTQPGRSFLVGERGPELFTPNQTGSVTPIMAGEGGRPQVNLNVVNVRDPDEVPAAINDGQADDAILNVLARNPQRARQTLSL